MPYHHFIPLILLTLLISSPASALILVTTAEDELQVDGDCSLREALRSANANEAYDNCGLGAPGADEIIIPLVDTLVIDSRLEIREAVTITGVSPTETRISGNGASQLFDIDLLSGSGDVILENLGLQDGFVENGTGGGALDVDCASLLRIENVHFRDNVSAGTGLDNGPGGALRMRPSGGCGARLELIDTLFIGNQSLANAGGAVWLSNSAQGFSSVLIDRSRFVNNDADTGGGGLFAFDIPNLSLINSLFEGNRGDLIGAPNSNGGAIALDADTSGPALALLRNLSVTDNFAGLRGGGLHVSGGQVAALTNVSLIGNTADNALGHAISVDDGATLVGYFLTAYDNGTGAVDDAALQVRFNATANIGHSIFANAWPSNRLCDVSADATYDSLGYVVDQSSTCTDEPNDLPLTEPDLVGPIRRLMGSTGFTVPVMMPAEGSAGVDIGPSTCPGPLATTTTNDQLGRARPVLDNRGAADCDAGAIERQPGELGALLSDRFES
ncbi:hypothetical protein AY599_24640 [Leptolyngbya valderiana BDU 20041]|nr:hypothetical protein AY599_24640 [Leptolyngbya valderiana BDU 20041]